MNSDDELNTRVDPAFKTTDSDATRDSTYSPAPSSGSFEIRCPHCSQTQVFSIEREPGSLRCPNCYRSFNLLEESSDASFVAFDRFKPIDQLGRGGFGVVWKAWDNQLNRIVAVKFPRVARLDREGLERSMREARAAARLDHENIVRIYDVCLCNDAPVLVSQYIDGQPLDGYLKRRGILSPHTAAAMCMQVAQGLQHAHEHGVVHRDLKPGNILVDGQNHIHITDFGLAKSQSEDVTITREGQLVGTPAYMAPEQAIGGREVDHRCDVYALGTVLYQLTTGERPFRGTLRMLIRQVIEDAPISPRKLNAAIPRDLETIILKCLSKRPTDRYSSAADLRDDLSRFLRGDVIRAKPPTLWQVFQRWYPKHASIMLGAYFFITPLTWVFFIFSGQLQMSADPDTLRLDSIVLLPWAMTWIGLGWCMLKYGGIFQVVNLILLILFASLPLFMPGQIQSWVLVTMISLFGFVLQFGAMISARRPLQMDVDPPS